jgi:ribosomal protein L21E
VKGFQFENFKEGGEKVKNKIVSITLAVVLILSVGLIGCTTEYVPEITEYNLAISSTEGGAVTTPGEGTFTYYEGEMVNLATVAEKGYHFVNWAGDVSSVDDPNTASTTITVEGDCSISASFVAVYDLTISSTQGGEVTAPGEGTFTYDEGTVISLVAKPDKGYQFVNWSGDVDTIADVNATMTTITMNGDYLITANFMAQYDLTISSTSGGSVTEPGEGVFSYDAGTVVNLVATPLSYYYFFTWTGDVGTIASVNSASTTITMNSDYSITAHFMIPVIPVTYYTVTMAVNGNGSTSPSVGQHTYAAGTVVSLVATPASGYRFSHWSGDASGTSLSTTITMNSDKDVTANFVRQYTLTINISGQGTTNPSQGTHTYDAGTVVTITANPASGWKFDHWGGDASGTSTSVSVTMNSNKSVTAYFTEEITYYTLTMHASPSGGGTTTPSVGSHSYAAGTVVSLSAAPALGYRFSHWSGDASGTSPSTTITMNSNKYVTANFVRQYTLTINISGQGSTNPSQGTHTYDEGTVVTITANPASGWKFDHWGGDASGTSTSVSVTMNSNKSVTAYFTEEITYYTLTMHASPSGGGTTTPSVGSHSYAAGTVVSLSAAPALGYRFSHWSGDASGTSPSTTITMNSNKYVTANFVRQYTLTINISGQGSTNPSQGTHTYDEGTVVTITANPASGWKFDHWGGDASGTSTSVNVTMNSNKSVTAYFSEEIT